MLGPLGLPLAGAWGLAGPCWDLLLTPSLSLPPQGLPGVPGKRGKMGRPVKIFRVYYADSMGELDLPLATLPCLPAAWAFSACSSAWSSLCFECVGRHAGLSGPRVLLPGWGWGSRGVWAPLGRSLCVCVHRLLCTAALCREWWFCHRGRECTCRGPAQTAGSWLGQALALQAPRIVSVVSASWFHLCVPRDRGRWGAGQAPSRCDHEGLSSNPPICQLCP